jgi:hypothetical protein
MARLPSMTYLVQQIGRWVICFEDFTEREIAKFDAGDLDGAMAALDVIRGSELSDEDRCYASFWAGYFAFHGGAQLPVTGCPVTYGPRGLAWVRAEGSVVPVVVFDPGDGSETAKAQKHIFDSAMSDEAKSRAYFWCGVLHGQEG